jgi:hypothetical protein
MAIPKNKNAIMHENRDGNMTGPNITLKITPSQTGFHIQGASPHSDDQHLRKAVRNFLPKPKDVKRENHSPPLPDSDLRGQRD